MSQIFRQALLVGLDEPALFATADAGESVVGRVAEHHQDGLLPFDRLGRVALGCELGEWQLSLLVLNPARQRVGQVHPGALARGRVQRHPEALEGEADLGGAQ